MISVKKNRRCATAGVASRVAPWMDSAKRALWYMLPLLKRQASPNKNMLVSQDKPSSSATALSLYVWSMRDKGKEPTVRWRILDKGKAYQPGSNGCALCLTEKYRILMADRTTSLNKRSELVAKCRHSAKFKLEAVTWSWFLFLLSLLPVY